MNVKRGERVEEREIESETQKEREAKFVCLLNELTLTMTSETCASLKQEREMRTLWANRYPRVELTRT